MLERSAAEHGKPSMLSKLAVQCAQWYREVHEAAHPDKKMLDKYGVWAIDPPPRWLLAANIA
jgi:hypothetical protein